MITSPVSGSLDNSEGLSSRYGVAIHPFTGKICAPTNGIIESARNHSIIIRNKDGFRIQILIGEETENADNSIHIKTHENTMVSRGEQLAAFDRRKMLSRNTDLTVTVTVCNPESGTEILKATSQNFKIGDELFVII